MSRLPRVTGLLRHNDGRSTVVPTHSGEMICPGLLHTILLDCQLKLDELNNLCGARQAMKKTLSPAKLPPPKFRSDKEAAKYFNEHSVANIWEQLPKGKMVKVSAALEKKIRERDAKAKASISIRLEP